VVEHWPVRCRSCAHVFGEPERVDAAEPSRHQVAELPPIAIRVTEHRLHGVCCPECATRTRAELPREVPRSAFGPRLQAAVVTLAVRNRVSRRDTTELARELFGVELSTGSVDAIIQRAGEALAGPHTQLEQRIKSASVVNIDETGWKTAGGHRTLWDALTSATAVFRIAPGRHAFEARTLLGEPSPGSSARTAGVATTTSTPPSGSSAGHTWSGTSRPTARAWPTRKSSDTAAS